MQPDVDRSRLLPGGPSSRWRPQPGGLITSWSLVWTLLALLSCCSFQALRASMGNLISVGGILITPVMLGEIGYVFLAASMVYLIRKRLGLATVGQLAPWLWAHVYLGLLGVMFVWYHSRQRFTPDMWLANLAMFLFIFSALTGIVTRLGYVFLPRLLYLLKFYDPPVILEERAKVLETEAETFTGFKSAFFHSVYNQLRGMALTPAVYEGVWFRMQRQTLPPQEVDDFDRMAEVLLERGALLETAARRRLMRRVMDVWWLAHVWLTLIGWFFATIHVLDSLLLQGRWS